jgi:hypothetical protein
MIRPPADRPMAPSQSLLRQRILSDVQVVVSQGVPMVKSQSLLHQRILSDPVTAVVPVVPALSLNRFFISE